MTQLTILNFSGIYESESFYNEDEDALFLDLKDISGTNCMCDDMAKEILLKRLLGREKGIHFIDSGNYHYASALFASMIKEPFSLVVLDHHPDMQRPMFDILSCGSWVVDVLDHNEFVRDIHIIGADKKLIGELEESDRKRVNFYDLSDAFKDDDIILPDTKYPVFLSIDKDVISRKELVTNWDQGNATASMILDFTEKLLKRDVLAIDICGECSPDQQDIDLEKAVCDNDDFNLRALKTCKHQRNSV